MAGKKKTTIEEPKLLKALKELEAVAKGDALADADTEGGLATEGKPLSAQAPSGKTDTKKSRASASSSSSSSSSSVEKAESADDDDDDSSSSSSSSGTAKAFSASDMASGREDHDSKSKKKKGKKPPFAKAAGGSSRSSSDDESSDDGDEAEKSFRDAADDDETMGKAIDISPFLEAMVDQFSVTMAKMEKRIEKSIAAAVGQLTAHVDNRVSKSIASTREFDARLAKAVAAIGETVQGDLVDMLKSLSDQPAPAPRGKALLSKGEVNQPPWSGGGRQMADGSDEGAGDYAAQLAELSPEDIGNWLFKAASNNKVDPKLIMAWEADRYNPEALPVQVQKSLVNDLCK